MNHSCDTDSVMSVFSGITAVTVKVLRVFLHESQLEVCQDKHEPGDGAQSQEVW